MVLVTERHRLHALAFAGCSAAARCGPDPSENHPARHRRIAVIYVSRHPGDLTAGMTFILKPLHLAPDDGEGVGSGTGVQNWHRSNSFARSGLNHDPVAQLLLQDTPRLQARGKT